MNDVKGILQSKTVWGSALAFIATLAQIAGYDIGETNFLAEQIVAVIGGVLAIYGRVTAVTKIGK
jgi:hypothetical protein